MRKFLVAAATAIALAALSVLPASAVDGNTTVSLSSVSTLTIVPQAAAALTTTGTTASGTLGATTVLDPGGSNLTVSISSAGDFADVSDAGNTLADSLISACLNAAPTLVSDLNLTTDPSFNAQDTDCTDANSDLSAANTLFTVTGVGAATEFTFVPKLSVDLSSTSGAIYQGTITQTVVVT